MKSKLTPELAELCGIIVGDGHLSRYISKKRTDYKLYIVGHRVDDKEYLDIVRGMITRITGFLPRMYDYGKYLEIRVYSKKIVEFFENLEIPVGNKSGIVRIPSMIKKNLELSCSFLRGLADTDFGIVLYNRKRKKPYPRITTHLKSKEIILEICNILNNLRISYSGPYKRDQVRNQSHCITYEININGHENLRRWMENIGFRNPKHLEKINKIEDG